MGSSTGSGETCTTTGSASTVVCNQEVVERRRKMSVYVQMMTRNKWFGGLGSELYDRSCFGIRLLMLEMISTNGFTQNGMGFGI